MSQSANTLEGRKVTTAHRINVCALGLTDAHGLDGFTMEDLADAAGVSRRTLFNYFPSKVDAVLGREPVIEPALLERFRAGGPHGTLLDDIEVVVAELFAGDELTRDEADTARRVVRSTPRLILAVHERFEAAVTEFTSVILDREGPEFGQSRARLLVTLLASLYDLALDEVLDDPTGRRTMAEAFLDTLRTARDLLA
ncbi:TetR/AcrR family transcriptional regulator [Nocardioides donggukensis]|uniref:TetR family transcriptional regulator n=1 Tax=Nocardioides donggukensis TaxID=2774019 RepID=A0A927PZU3_9ACTN|nr:TetR/AcrR family transcriptional regulator [Nocardioides donggukensis]MBD8868052.1 TetR family transcriptional regulator [Nocardioides donggukensis]